MWVSAVTAAMMATEFTDIGITTMMKAAMSRGMSQFVFIFYSSAFALFLLLPSSFFFYRKSPLPQLTLSILFRIFLQGLLSCCLQISMNTGVKYSSPTLYAAMIDLTPAFTFLLAVISRMEKLEFSLPSSQAKSIGTMVSVVGALIVTLYKGQPITALPSESTSLSSSFLFFLPMSNWVIGGILCTASAFFLALLLIVQTWILRDYPAELMVTSITCIFVTVLSAIVALITDKDPNVWILSPDIKLLAIVCSAILGVSMRSVVYAWACRQKGPLYTAMFKPLGMLIAVVLGVSCLGDTLYIGSVIGGIVIATGFYTVIWGKAQEQEEAEMVDQKVLDLESSSSPQVPLLKNKNVDDV